MSQIAGLLLSKSLSEIPESVVGGGTGQLYSEKRDSSAILVSSTELFQVCNAVLMLSEMVLVLREMVLVLVIENQLRHLPAAIRSAPRQAH